MSQPKLGYFEEGIWFETNLNLEGVKMELREFSVDSINVM